MKPIFEIEDFYFNYPLNEYKIGFNGKFEIFKGDCILIQGHSGSGKSTLLLALKGIIPHLINGEVTGKIYYNGRNIVLLNEQDLINIGYLQQNPDQQLIRDNVFAELAFGLENLAMTPKDIKQRINLLAEQFSLTSLLHRKVASLSGGEKQKVNLMSILLMDPDVLLLDEPTAFLDPESANDITRILQDFVRNKTVVIVEHNLQYLKKLVNRVINITTTGEIVEQDISKINWSPTIELQKVDLNQHKSEVILDVKKLHHSYKHDLILKNLDLTVHRGEIITIHGKNGAGKSTLLKLISKIIKTKKQIYLSNKDISEIKDISYWQHVNLLWQNPELHFITNKVLDEVDGDYDVLTKFGLQKQSQQSPFSLSEGQKRRLSLAISLKSDIELLLLDEPSFGQDQQNKLILIEKIKQLAQNGTAFIVTTHDEEFCNAISTRKLTLKDGVLIS